MHWDLFCRVVDNFGDIGVCWRLAADLAARGQAVRLWVDDASALAWMAPYGAPGVEVLGFDNAAQADPGEVVVEAFGCDPPAGFVARMAAQPSPPVWINLEYLSAEPWVERSHGLPSPQLAGPGAGLAKWFFFPGFTAGTGGLIREADLLPRQQAFDRGAWLLGNGAARQPGERIVSLFCYDSAPVDALLDRLGDQPTLLLAAAGVAGRRVSALLGPGLQRGLLRAELLPLLTQRDFDHLLWASDLNFVRGEDSFVRAQFAGRPFVWQIYPQHDGAHAAKLRAFLALFGAVAEAPLWLAWNGLAQPLPPLPPAGPWRARAAQWRDWLLAAGAPPHDLAAALIGFAKERQ